MRGYSQKFSRGVSSFFALLWGVLSPKSKEMKRKTKTVISQTARSVSPNAPTR